MMRFEKKKIFAKFINPSGEQVERETEIRTHPITGRTCRITLIRGQERERGGGSLPPIPPDANDTSRCPFCMPQVEKKTPKCIAEIAPDGHLRQGESRLFPNLFPYGNYSAVSLFDNLHFVEIGNASVTSYTDCLINCSRYLRRALAQDRDAIYMAITQNHLPSAGGSMVHPHLQIQADRIAANHHRFLEQTSHDYFQKTGRYLFSDYLKHEKKDGSRYIGKTGNWEWMAAFAPEGFFEIWGILPNCFSVRTTEESIWQGLAKGIINAQKFFRSLYRNGYNLGVLSIEESLSKLELRAVLMVRSNFAPWVRNDHTGFELMLGDMATFSLPEETARSARMFWE